MWANVAGMAVERSSRTAAIARLAGGIAPYRDRQHGDLPAGEPVDRAGTEPRICGQPRLQALQRLAGVRPGGAARDDDVDRAGGEVALQRGEALPRFEPIGQRGLTAGANAQAEDRHRDQDQDDDRRREPEPRPAQHEPDDRPPRTV